MALYTIRYPVVEILGYITNKIQVTYDVTYVYPLLFVAVGGLDSSIQSAIGNFQAVRTGLDQQTDFTSFFPVLNDASFFSFSGSSICTVAQCNGTFVSCTDVTAGITATCVSNCKTGYCYNNGLCLHTDPNVTPTCRCPTFADLWILGQRCETKIALWLIVLLSVIGFLIILTVLIVVIVCVLKRRRKLARKRELLKTAPRSHVNAAFRNDEIRNPANGALNSSFPRNARPIAREDSFETVTSSEVPPSEYRSDRRRQSRNTSSVTSPRRTQGNSDTVDQRTTARESPRNNLTSSSSEEPENENDDNNISFYEVTVNDLDLQSDAASSVIAVSSGKPSPIKWLAPKNDGPRPGWVPSLGPMMYELPSAKKTNTLESEQSAAERRRRHGTDV